MSMKKPWNNYKRLAIVFIDDTHDIDRGDGYGENKEASYFSC